MLEKICGLAELGSELSSPHFVAGDSLMRKLANEMTCDWAATFPAVVLRKRNGVSVELISCDVWMLMEVAFPSGESLLQQLE